MNDGTTRTRPCPRCGEPVTWNAVARWKPFCSERCRMIDLGAWFAEEHVIPGRPAGLPDVPQDENENN